MAINFAKLDPILTGDVQVQRDPNAKDISVTIETIAIPDAAQIAFLARLGVKQYDVAKTAFPTPNLSLNDIEALSNESWVRRLWGDIQFGTFGL